MKVFKVVLVIAVALSGYIGYSNFLSVNLDDYVDLILKIVQTLAPLGAPYLASRTRKDKKGEIKTLDEDLRDVAEHLGVSKAFIRGKLGLGDMRKKQSRTVHKRRIND